MEKDTCTRMRIYMDEEDKFEHRPLWEKVLDKLHDHKIAGAIILRGLSGYGRNTKIRTPESFAWERRSPIVVEAVDTPEKIDAILSTINEMTERRLITLEPVEVPKLMG